MSFYRKNTKEIINLLDDLEKKLNRNRPPSPSPNNNLNQNLFSTERNFYFNKNNSDIITPSMEFKIRNIIRDEFNSLILPYQQELHEGMNIIDSKIDKNTNEIKDLKLKSVNNFLSNNNSGLNFGQPNPFDNSQYVLRVEYENKIKELEVQISTLNSYSKTLKEAIDNKSNENNDYLSRDEYGQKLKEIQNQFNSISGEINQIKNNMINYNQSLNEIKIDSNKQKNDLLAELENIKNDFSEKVQDMNNNLNNTNGIIQSQNNANEVNGKIQNVSNGLNNLKNEFDVFTKQLDMNFMASLKTIVNQHVTIAEFNVEKNRISIIENNINEILNKNKNYDININSIQNNLNKLENKINNINMNNKSDSEIKEFNATNKNNINLDENQLNLLTELQNIDMKKLKKFDFDSFDELRNEINIIKNNNENLVLLRTKINELDTEIKKLKEKIDFDGSILDLKNKITSIIERINRLEKFHLKSSKVRVEQIDDGGDKNINNIFAENDINMFNKKKKEVIESENFGLSQSDSENNLENNKQNNDDDEFKEPEIDDISKKNNTKAQINTEEEKKENERRDGNEENNNKRNNENEDYDIGELDDILV